MSRVKCISGIWQMTGRPQFKRANNRERKSKPTKKSQPSLPDCPHRSQAFALVDCKTCRGHVQVKVFDCDKFGACCTAAGGVVGESMTLSCAKCEVPHAKSD